MTPETIDKMKSVAVALAAGIVACLVSCGVALIIMPSPPVVRAAGDVIDAKSIAAEEIRLKPGGKIIVELKNRDGTVSECHISESMIRRIVTCP